MYQPKGYIQSGKEDHIYLLNNSLYGLKQSPRHWYKMFDTFIVFLGYCKSTYNSCVYTKCENRKAIVFLLLYVDDMLLVV